MFICLLPVRAADPSGLTALSSFALAPSFTQLACQCRHAAPPPPCPAADLNLLKLCCQSVAHGPPLTAPKSPPFGQNGRRSGGFYHEGPRIYTKPCSEGFIREGPREGFIREGPLRAAKTMRRSFGAKGHKWPLRATKPCGTPLLPQGFVFLRGSSWLKPLPQGFASLSVPSREKWQSIHKPRLHRHKGSGEQSSLRPMRGEECHSPLVNDENVGSMTMRRLLPADSMVEG